jgi:hypothetical protein
VRKERGLRDQNFDAPEALPDLDENSDTEVRRPDIGKNSDTEVRRPDIDESRDTVVRPQGEDTTNADSADELSANGTDERGLGNETFPGRDDAVDARGEVVRGKGSVRVRLGPQGPKQVRPNCGGLARPSRRRKLSRATSTSWLK